MLKKISCIVLIILNIGCDQVSKEMVRDKILPHDSIELIGSNFILTNVENTGAMLGAGSNLSPVLKLIFLQLLPVLVLGILLFRILKRKELPIPLLIAFSFVIGGGIGNLFDRIALGSVTDFFFIQLGFLRTGIFNMADVSVTVGVLVLLFLSFGSKKYSL